MRCVIVPRPRMGFMDRLIPFLDFDNVRVFIRANFLFSPPDIAATCYWESNCGKLLCIAFSRSINCYTRIFFSLYRNIKIIILHKYATRIRISFFFFFFSLASRESVKLSLQFSRSICCCLLEMVDFRRRDFIVRIFLWSSW